MSIAKGSGTTQGRLPRYRLRSRPLRPIKISLDLVWSSLWRGSIAIFALAVSFASARTLPSTDAALVAASMALSALFSLADGGFLFAFTSQIDTDDYSESMSLARAAAKAMMKKRVAAFSTGSVLLAAVALEFGLSKTAVLAVLSQAIANAAALIFAPWERVLVMRRSYRTLAATTLVALAVPSLAVVGTTLRLWQPSLPFWLVIAGSVPLFPRLLIAARCWSHSKSGKVFEHHLAGQFLLIQAVSVVAFSTDVVVAKMLSLDHAAVQLSMIARLLGPGALLIGILQQDIWPLVSLAKKISPDSARLEGRRLVIRSAKVSAVFAVLCLPLPALANTVLPQYANLSLSLALTSALWFVLLSTGSAAGQVLLALGRQRENIPHNIAMALANLAGSVLLGRSYGAIGFLLSSLISYGTILFVPNLKTISR